MQETEREEKSSDGYPSAWEARRRRISRVKGTETGKTTSGKTNGRSKDLPIDEYDPYDSDPGESYREHCDRIKGERTRSCLAMPRFLQNKVSNAPDTEATSPPSPLDGSSEEALSRGQAPTSLPSDLARVRYSLRTSISDGSQAQPSAAHLMERRDLRPNNVHINVSHWSDFGGRNYMEDRYVSGTVFLSNKLSFSSHPSYIFFYNPFLQQICY